MFEGLRSLLSRLTGRHKREEPNPERWLNGIFILAALRSRPMVVEIRLDKDDPNRLKAEIQREACGDRIGCTPATGFDEIVQLLMIRAKKPRDRYGKRTPSVSQAEFLHEAPGNGAIRVNALIYRKNQSEGGDRIQLNIHPLLS